LLETWKCSAKTFWRLRKWFNIRGPAVPTVEDGLDNATARLLTRESLTHHYSRSRRSEAGTCKRR
jgi:hypothetical protein